MGRAILSDQLRRPIEQAPDLPDSARRAQLALVAQRVDLMAQSSPWTRWFADYDPLPTARRVRVPVLILQGALDLGAAGVGRLLQLSEPERSVGREEDGLESGRQVWGQARAST